MLHFDNTYGMTHISHFKPSSTPNSMLAFLRSWHSGRKAGNPIAHSPPPSLCLSQHGSTGLTSLSGTSVWREKFNWMGIFNNSSVYVPSRLKTNRIKQVKNLDRTSFVFYRSIFIEGSTSMTWVLGRRGPANIPAAGRHTLHSCLPGAICNCISMDDRSKLGITHCKETMVFKPWITEALVERKHVSIILFAYHGFLLRDCS